MPWVSSTILSRVSACYQNFIVGKDRGILLLFEAKGRPRRRLSVRCGLRHEDFLTFQPRYRDIRYYNMSKGEVRFATRVFPWTLYPPAVLKSHMCRGVHE